MADIVSRLRANIAPSLSDCREAASEIERLRGLLKTNDVEGVSPTPKIRAVQYAPEYCQEAAEDAAKNGMRPWRWDTSHDLTIIDGEGAKHRVGTFITADTADAVGKLIESHGEWPVVVRNIQVDAITKEAQ